MNKIYQPEIKSKANNIIETLKELGFFDIHEMKTIDFAYDYFCDKLTEKFIAGSIADEFEFTEQEFDKCLNEIIVHSYLDVLKNEGLVSSFDNDNGEEFYFLTEKGKKNMLVKKEKK